MPGKPILCHLPEPLGHAFIAFTQQSLEPRSEMVELGCSGSASASHTRFGFGRHGLNTPASDDV